MSDETKPETILEEAARLTSGDRQETYGHPSDNHDTTGSLWGVYLRRRYQAALAAGAPVHLDARDVCWLNVLQKASRDAWCRKRDNLVDAAGYLRNAEMIEEHEREERTESGDFWAEVRDYLSEPPPAPAPLADHDVPQDGGGVPPWAGRPAPADWSDAP